MKSLLFSFYAYLFSRPSAYALNRVLFYLSLRGLGILNYYNHKVSGEKHIHIKLKNKNIQVIFDVGANLGNYIKMIDRIYTNADIYAFEPHPKTFKALQSIQCESKVIFENYAISDNNGTVRLYDYGDGTEHGSIFKEQIEQYKAEDVTSFDVVSKTLDGYCEEKGVLKIDFLKIDVEGAEYKVLQGARKLLNEKRIRFIQFEFNSSGVSSRVYFKDFFLLLSGYKLYRVLTNGLLPLNYSNPELVEVFAFQNILAVAEGEGI